MTEPWDVCLTTKARHDDRIGLAFATIAWWCAEVLAGRVRLTVVDIGADAFLLDMLVVRGLRKYIHAWLDKPAAGSQALRHRWAAAWCTSPLYLTVDDDLRPLPRLWRSRPGTPVEGWQDYAVRIFTARPTLAMACAWPMPGGTDPEALGRHAPPDPDFYSVASCGGVRVMRAGLELHEAPGLDPDCGGGYDTTFCAWLRKRGHDTGFLYRWRAVHHGFGASETWRGDLWPDAGSAVLRNPGPAGIVGPDA